EVAEHLGEECVIIVGYEWADALDGLVAAFGADTVVLEYAATLRPEDTDHHDIVDAMRARHQLCAIATALPAAATRKAARLAAATLPPTRAPRPRSGAQMRVLTPERVAAIAFTGQLARACAWSSAALAPNRARWEGPAGLDAMSWLREIGAQRAPQRYRALPK